MSYVQRCTSTYPGATTLAGSAIRCDYPAGHVERHGNSYAARYWSDPDAEAAIDRGIDPAVGAEDWRELVGDPRIEEDRAERAAAAIDRRAQSAPLVTRHDGERDARWIGRETPREPDAFDRWAREGRKPR